MSATGQTAACESYVDLLAQGALVMATLDEIDDIVDIGVPMDELVEVLDEIKAVEAIREIARTGIDLNRVADAVAQDTTLAWRVDWLTRTTGCSTAAAEKVALTEPTRLRRFLALDDRLGLLDVLRASAEASATDLAAVIARHPAPAPAVPDTIPTEWLT